MVNKELNGQKTFMNISMTRNTNGNNIKPAFWRITGMMILFCLYFTVMTTQSIGTGQFASPNSSRHNLFCFMSFRMPNTVALISFLAFSFAFFCLVIIFFADFAFIAMSIFSCMVFVKFRDCFGLLATSASFRYDLFRHGFFLTKKLCLEPLQTHYLCGSFYNNTSQLNCEQINKKNKYRSYGV